MQELIIHIGWPQFAGIIASLFSIVWFSSKKFSVLENDVHWLKDTVRELKDSMKDLKSTVEKIYQAQR